MLPGRTSPGGGGGRDKKNAKETAAHARAERARRKVDKESATVAERERAAATAIQRGWSKYIGLQRLRLELRPRFDAELAAMAAAKPTAAQLFGAVGRLLLFCDPRQAEYRRRAVGVSVQRAALFREHGDHAVADAERLSALAKRITKSFSADAKTNYCANCLDQQPVLPAGKAGPGRTPTRSAAWQKQIKKLCALLLLKLEQLPKGGKEQYSSEMQALILLTDFKCWQLKVPAQVFPLFAKMVNGVLDDMVGPRGRLYPRLRSFMLTHHLLKDEAIFAQSALLLAMRPLSLARADEAALQAFALGFATIPALAPRLPAPARAVVATMWPRLVSYLATQPEAIVAEMGGSQTVALAVVANCAEGLFSGTAQPPAEQVAAFVQMVQWASSALAGAPLAAGAGGAASPVKQPTAKGGSKTYHPVFGWVKGGMVASAAGKLALTQAERLDAERAEKTEHAQQLAQLRVLWSAPVLRQIFGLQAAPPPVVLPLRDALDVEFEPLSFESEPEPEPEPKSGGFGGFFGSSPARIGIATPTPPIGGGGGGGGGAGSVGADLIGACSLYNSMYKCLPALKLELIASLCFALKDPPLIVELWRRIDSDVGAHKRRLLTNASDLSTDPFSPLLELFLQVSHVLIYQSPACFTDLSIAGMFY